MKKFIGRASNCFDRLYNSLRKKFGLNYGNTLKELEEVFEDETFGKLPVILVSNDDTMSNEFIKELNDKGEVQAYGYYHDGPWAYNDVLEVRQMIPTILSDNVESEKFVYVSVEKKNRFKLDIPGSVCIKLTVEDDGDLYLDIFLNKVDAAKESIRVFRASDGEQVNGLLHEFYYGRWSRRPDLFEKDYSLSDKDIEELCTWGSGSEAMVCLKGGRVVGVAIYSYRNDATAKSRVMIVNDIYVIKQYRRKGIATRMYWELQKRMEEYRCRRIRFRVLDDDSETKLFVTSLQPKKLYTLYELDVLE